MIIKSALKTMLIATTLAFAVSTNSAAITIGDGPALGGASLDTGGSRLNVEETFVNLGAGTYDVLSFDFLSAGNTGGTFVGFLATLTGTNEYTTIYVGPGFAANGTGTETQSFALGTQQFILGAAIDVYVGFVADSNFVTFAGGGQTDHDNPGQFNAGSGSGPFVINSFSNANLGRTYSFSATVALAPPPTTPNPPTADVPEPGTLAIFGLGLAGLGYIRRRRAA